MRQINRDYRQSLKEQVLYNWTMFKPIVRRRGGHGLSAPLVVSLTSYPPRFPTLAATLRTLLAQSIRPDVLVLWIGHDDWPKLPRNVLGLRGKGLVIKRTDSLRSYTKIIPALSEYEGCFIATADDDICYPSWWLERLVTGSNDQTGDIVCHRAHRIILDEDDKPLPYMNWELDTRERESSALIFPTGVGGVLYPPGVFHQDVVREDLFTQLAPTGDDLWLYWMARLNGARFRRIEEALVRFIHWPGSQNVSLWSLNQQSEKGNDLQIGRLIKKYGFPA